MKTIVTFFAAVILVSLLQSFKSNDEIAPCYISFTQPTNLAAVEPGRLPGSSEKIRKLISEDGEVEVTRIDGYRILYNNDKNVPFVNLKIELSEKRYYKKDQENLIKHLRYLNSHSLNMETKDLIELEFNGFKIYGFSRASIEAGSTLGTFVMFPGKGITVYFYFNNLKPGYRNFENVEDYKMQRDRFINEYTKYLTTCKDK